jgi:hypothetical protein
MSTLGFDTLEHIKKLKAVGFTDAQAEAQTGLIVNLIETQVVTREYLNSRLQIELAPIKADSVLLKWMMSIVLGGIMTLILKAFFPV